MRVAHVFAELSYDKRLQVGSVIVKDRQILAEGYNGTVSGQPNVNQMDDGKTSPFVLHSEQNAILKLAKSHNSSVGATIYITHSPCAMCAKLIAQAGIVRVVYGKKYRDEEPIRFLNSCGIKVEQLELKQYDL